MSKRRFLYFILFYFNKHFTAFIICQCYSKHFKYLLHMIVPAVTVVSPLAGDETGGEGERHALGLCSSSPWCRSLQCFGAATLYFKEYIKLQANFSHMNLDVFTGYLTTLQRSLILQFSLRNWKLPLIGCFNFEHVNFFECQNFFLYKSLCHSPSLPSSPQIILK